MKYCQLYVALKLNFITNRLAKPHKLLVPYVQFICDETIKAKNPKRYSLLNCHESSNIYRMQL